MSRHGWGTLTLGLMAANLPFGGTAQADYEAHVYVITNWPSSGVCSAKDIGSWDDMAFAWYDEMDDEGIFYRAASKTNGGMSRAPLCDPDAQSGCSDHLNIDAADAALLALHGSDVDRHWAGSLLTATSNDCRIHAPQGAATDALFVGDSDLEFLHLSSCNSMDDDNLKWTWRMFQDVDSASNGHRLHQVDGFHGVMWISAGRADDYEDFAEDGHDGSLRAAWLDNLYDTDVKGVYDQCPVAYAISNTFANAKTRLNNEGYDNIYSDPPSAAYVAFGAYIGCNPKADDPFNDPWL